MQMGKHRKFVELIEQRVLPYSDFVNMIVLTVGRFWREANTAHQKELTKEFRDLLVCPYPSVLTSCRRQKFEYMSLLAVFRATDALVRVSVRRPIAQPVNIDCAIEKAPSGWQECDVLVDGVNLGANYCAELVNQALAPEGGDGPIRALRAKTKQIARQGLSKGGQR